MTERTSTVRYSLSRDLRRFAVEALCLLMLFYGAPLQALEETVEPIAFEEFDNGPESATESSADLSGITSKVVEWIEPVVTGVQESAETVQQGATELASQFVHQPWGDALAMLVTASSLGLTQAPSAPPSPPSDPDRPNKSYDLESLAAGFPEASGADKNTLDAVPLLPGWNQVSLPEVPASSAPATVLAGIGGSYHKVYTYDGCDTADPWKVYDPNDATSSDLAAVTVEQGLLIDATTAVSLPSDGTLPDSTTFNLCTGWNLIGFPSAHPRHVKSALAPILDKVVRVFAFDPFDFADNWKFYEASAPAWASDLDIMEPGKGYWILVTEDVSLDIKNVGDAPSIAFTSPQDLDVITAPTEIQGTVASDLLDNWQLRFRGVGENDWIELATGNYPVDGRLGDFDPTLLLNGMYELELVATDLQGLQVSDSIAIVVEGNMKIGHFTLSFVDLAIPLSGLDIQVVRTYDSRAALANSSSGVFSGDDFGPGWSLGIRQGSYRNNRPPGDGWVIQPTEGPWGLPCSENAIQELKSHLTTIQLSDQEIYHFALTVRDPGTVIGGCFARVEFEFLHGRIPGAKLEILGNDEVIYQNNSDELLDRDTLTTFIPQDVQLTTLDGRIFELNLQDGVRHLKDTHGNHLQITPSGITHSSGRGVEFVRDSQGRIERLVDPLGNSHHYTYDAVGDLVSSRDRADDTTRFEYQTGHLLHRILAADGRQLAAVEFARGRVQRMCNGTNDCTALEHDLDGRQETIIDPTLRQTRYAYDERGNITSITNGLGQTSNRTYNSRDQVTSHTDPLGRTTTLQYDSEGNLAAIQQPHGPDESAADFTTTFEHNARGRMTSAQRPGGVRRDLIFDDAGSLLEIRDEAGELLRSWTHDAGGNVLTESDRFGTEQYLDLTGGGEPQRVIERNGNVVTATYDLLGNVSELQIDSTTSIYSYDGLGRETLADYDDFTVASHFGESGSVRTTHNSLVGPVHRDEDLNGRLTAWRSPNGAQLSRSYDAAGRLVGQTSPTGLTTEYAYDDAGRPLQITYPTGNTVTLQRDAAGRVTEATDGLGRVEKRTYNPRGGLASVEDALGNFWQLRSGPGWSETEDPLGRVQRRQHGPDGELEGVNYADGNTLQVSYLEATPPGERADHVTSVVDEGGRTRTYTYDAVGALATASDLAGNVWTYDYPDLNDLSVTSPESNLVYSETYDPRDRRTSRTYGDGGTMSWSYGSDPEPSRLTLPSAATVDYTYDTAGQLTSTATSDGQNQSWTRDLDGRTVQMTDDIGTTTYAYGSGGNLESILHTDGSKIRYEYDLVGQMTLLATTPPGGSAEAISRYTYDVAGNLTGIQDPTGGQTSFEYDAVRRPVRRVLPSAIETTWQYDLRDRILAIEHLDSDANVLLSFTYQRGPMGEPTRVDRHDGSYTEYDYDAAFRVAAERHFDTSGITVKTLEYTYDTAGNRTGVREDGVLQASTYGPGQQLQSTSSDGVPAASYSWDADGRLASQQSDGETWNLDHDAYDHLRSAQSSSGETWSYAYDANGRRTVVHRPSGDSERHLMAPGNSEEPWDLLHSITVANETTQFVHWGTTPLIAVSNAGTTYLLEDGLGNVGGRYDSNDLEQMRYTAYGVQLEGDTAHTSSGGFGFHGEWHDAGSGLYHLRARQYDPETGRFLSRDNALGDPNQPESHHPYLFANANPLVFGDPTGLFTLVEVNINLSSQNIIQTTKIEAQNEIREEIRDRVYEIISNALTDYIQSAFGLHQGSFAPFTQANNKLGQLFENASLGIYCATLGDLLGHLTWLEPGINEKGQPQTNGYSCEERGEQGIGRPAAGVRHPDFVLRESRPRQTRTKSYLIGEIKLGVNTFRSAWTKKRRGQWEAIHKYAKKHGYPPHVVMLIAYRKGTKARGKRKAELDLRWLERKIREAKVAGAIVVIRDNFSSKSKGGKK